MVSYWKTQWFRVLIASVHLGLALFYMFQPAPDTSTLEGLNALTSNMFSATVQVTCFFVWLFMSFIEYHADCIKALEKRIEILEDSAITDIDKTGPNDYMVRRRLGPDKNVPFPDEEIGGD